MAKRALIWALVSIVINPLLIVSIVAIVTGAKGRAEARVIEAMGFGPAHSRRGTAGAAIGIGVGVIAVQLLGAAIWVWGQQPHYDQGKIEASIVNDVTGRVGVAGATVSCPPTSSFSSGTTFDCEVGVPGGTTRFAHVKVVDNYGNYQVSYGLTASA